MLSGQRSERFTTASSRILLKISSSHFYMHQSCILLFKDQNPFITEFHSYKYWEGNILYSLGHITGQEQSVVESSVIQLQVQEYTATKHPLMADY